jgi:hypothetical protein
MATKKQVTIIARYAHKTNGKLNGTVTYLVRASNGVDTYCTTLVEGKASGCNCPSRSKNGCYHKTQLEKKEQARPFAARSLPVWTAELVESGKLAVPGKKAVTKSVMQDSTRLEELAKTSFLAQYDLSVVNLAKKHDGIVRRIEDAPLTTNRGFSLMR